MAPNPTRSGMGRPDPTIGFDPATRAALLDTGLPGLKEVLDYTFYDSASITNGLTTIQNLFQAASNNILNSNFVGAGQMPSGQAFLVKTIRFITAMGSAGQDVINLMKGVQLRFTLENSKKYVDALGQFFPAGIGATLEQIPGTTAALATGISLGNNGVPVLGNVYRFTRPVVLHTLQPFQIDLIPQAPVLIAPVRVYVAIDGVYVRNAI